MTVHPTLALSHVENLHEAFRLVRLPISACTGETPVATIRDPRPPVFGLIIKIPHRELAGETMGQGYPSFSIRNILTQIHVGNLVTVSVRLIIVIGHSGHFRNGVVIFSEFL
jgi:hypothetical protein